jgi:hypothetical protein
MTESYTPPYQPKIELEAIDLLTVQVEKQMKECNETIAKINILTARLKVQQEGLQMTLNNLKLEKLKQSREGYSNLEVGSV